MQSSPNLRRPLSVPSPCCGLLLTTTCTEKQGMNIVQEGVGVQGDKVKFAQYGHLATRLLELLREGQHGPLPTDHQPETDEDHITGRYIYIDAPVWGRSKVFYETSGTGPQQIVFLHTAGSDSRQYHGVMNDSRMREQCTMIAFDLPAHGRSFPGSNRMLCIFFLFLLSHLHFPTFH